MGCRILKRRTRIPRNAGRGTFGAAFTYGVERRQNPNFTITHKGIDNLILSDKALAANTGSN